MTTYEPSEVRSWSTNDLDRLIGHYTYVNVSGSETEGWVEAASVGRYGLPFIEYHDGTSVDWHPDTDEVCIGVHDGPIF